MEAYYFLFALGLIWTIFAIVVDMIKREVPNWLNFSLIGFAITYRLFYSLEKGEMGFFLIGVLGFVLFYGLANLFYYGKVFAGGDAKLLMGVGIILPYSNLAELFYWGVIFIVGLFVLGGVYSIVYSAYIAVREWKKYKKAFVKITNEFGKHIHRYMLLTIILGISIVLLSLMVNDVFPVIYFIFFFIVIALVYLHVKSFEVCMVRRVNAKDLAEGDWLMEDVKLARGVIKKSVYGLSLRDIAILKKAGKRVLIKDGIPFTPAFLLALLMVFFAEVLGVLPFFAFLS